MDIQLNYNPHPRQKLFHESPALYTLFGGSKGGGKSIALVNEVAQLSLEFDGNYGFLGRKRAVDFRTTTFVTFKQWIPSDLYVIKEQKKEIHWINGSVTLYGGLDNSEDIEKFNSMELGYFAIDQAEETTRSDFAALAGTLGRFKHSDGARPRYRAIMSCNPAPCWLKDAFILNPKPNYKFIQSLPSDNPYLTKEYYTNLEEAWKFNPAILNAYLHGSWDDIEGDNLLIPIKSINEAVDKPLAKAGTDFTVVSCDPARFGKDESAIYVIKNNTVIFYKIIPREDTMVTVGWNVKLFHDYKADLVIIDDNGVGGGPADRIAELKIPVYFMNSVETSETYANMREEMWYNAQKMFIGGEVSIPDDNVLIGQLASMRYWMKSSGKIELSNKKDMKKDLDKSPDRADALVQGLWAMKNLSGINYNWEDDEYQRQIRRSINGKGGY